jgi:two-component system LytT family sensor kinase
MPRRNNRSDLHVQVRSVAVLAVPLALVLTALFTAQEFVRGGPAARGQLGRVIALNALDWLVWAPFFALMLVIVRRARAADTRVVTLALTWVGLAIVCCVGVGVVTGAIANYFRLLPPAAAAIASEGVSRFLAAWIVNTLPLNVLVFCSLIGLLQATAAYADLATRRVREAELASRLTRAELSVLRMQLQPHFFFNTLHTVSSLMMTDVDAAQKVIASLGELVRASIDHTAHHEVSFREELGFVEKYLDIQRARFGQKLRVDVHVPAELLSAAVPSLLLQPLVENAIRHGVERSAGGGTVWVRAERDGPLVRLSVRNTLNGTGGDDGGQRGGIGLANIESRLSQLYGESQHFVARRNPLNEFEVSISLPYRQTFE